MPATAPALRLFDPAKNRNQRRQSRQRRHLVAVVNTPAAAPLPAAAAPRAAQDGGTVMPLTSSKITPEQAVLLEMFGRPPIAFHRALVDLASSVTAALWLSYALELSQQANSADLSISQEACHEATGLSRREQETARSKLRGAGLITERRVGKQVRFTLQLHIIAARLLAVCAKPWAQTGDQAHVAAAAFGTPSGH